MKTVIVKSGLTEKEAYDFERYLILYYVFELGYSIDIAGYRKSSDEKILTNHTFGGDGSFGMVHTEEWKRNHSEKMKGQRNPMYGINLWDTYSEEKSKEIKEKISLSSSGTHNPMYGVSPKNRMDHETYQKWYQKVSDRCKKQVGENNPNYHNDTLKKKLNEHPELKELYYKPKYGSLNPNSKSVNVYKNDKFIINFDCITDCCEWIKSELELSSKISSIRSSISEAIKYNKLYHGFIIKTNDTK